MDQASGHLKVFSAETGTHDILHLVTNGVETAVAIKSLFGSTMRAKYKFIEVFHGLTSQFVDNIPPWEDSRVYGAAVTRKQILILQTAETGFGSSTSTFMLRDLNQPKGTYFQVSLGPLYSSLGGSSISRGDGHYLALKDRGKRGTIKWANVDDLLDQQNPQGEFSMDKLQREVLCEMDALKDFKCIGIDDSTLTVAAIVEGENGAEISLFSLTPQGPQSMEEHSKCNSKKKFIVKLNEVD